MTREASTTTVADDELPLLGEPLAVEFANSLYEGADETVDFLSTPERVNVWFRAASVAKDVQVPSRLTRDDVARLGELRQVIRALLVAVASGQALAPDSVRSLNRFAAMAPSYARLEPAGKGLYAAVTTASAATLHGLLGRLAHEAIVLIGGASGSLVRRCGAPGCPMLFVQNHHRRRWCHESCGHRRRQAQYYRRKSGATKGSAQ